MKTKLLNLWSLYGVAPVKGDTASLYSTEYVNVGPSGKGANSITYESLKALLRKDGFISSFKILPNISSFSIILGKVNPLLLASGLINRYKPRIEYVTNRNRHFNRYLMRMQVILARKRQYPKIYWRYAHLLISRSNSYLVTCMHSIDKNLYRNETLKNYKLLILEVNKLRGWTAGGFNKSTLSHILKFHRTYIPKGDTVRPLGVPSLAWRIYLNMLLHPLVSFVKISPHQHGFQPFKGTNSAWKDILLEGINANDIFEFDLKQFFPSVSLPLASRILSESLGMPEHVARFYEGLNYAPPEFKGPIQLDESQSLKLTQTLAMNSHRGLNRRTHVVNGFPQSDRIGFNQAFQFLNPRTRVPNPNNIPIPMNDPRVKIATGIDAANLQAFLASLSYLPYIDNLYISNEVARSLQDRYNTARTRLLSEPGTHEWVKLIGTAQGSPLSPFLSIILLDEMIYNLPEGVKIKMYADDGIIYGKDIRAFVENHLKSFFARYGLVLSEEKSGWVKSEGKWLKELLFLGLIYNGSDDTLRGETRTMRAAKVLRDLGDTDPKVLRTPERIFYNKSALIQQDYDITKAMSLTEPQLITQVKYFKRQAGKQYDPNSKALNAAHNSLREELDKGLITFEVFESKLAELQTLAEFNSQYPLSMSMMNWYQTLLDMKQAFGTLRFAYDY